MQRKRFNGAVLQETSEPLLENQHHRGDSRDADSRIGLLGGLLGWPNTQSQDI